MKELIEQILAKKFTNAEELVNDSMLSKAIESLDEMKKNTAKAFFESTETSEEQIEQIEEDDSFEIGDLVEDSEGNIGQIVSENEDSYEVDWDLNEEQLNELSKKTLGSYIKKASISVEANARNAQDSNWSRRSAPDISTREGIKKNTLKYNKKVNKRKAGIQTAVKKLTKED